MVFKALSMYWWKLEISNIYCRIDNCIDENFAPINNIDNKTVQFPYNEIFLIDLDAFNGNNTETPISKMYKLVAYFVLLNICTL